jgi:hypothetical protein
MHDGRQANPGSRSALVVALAITVAAACGGSKSPPAPECGAACDQQSVAGIEVRTEGTAGGFRSTLIAAGARRHTFDWIASGGETSLTYTGPDGRARGAVSIAAAPVSAADATRTALYVFATLPGGAEPTTLHAGCSAVRELSGSLDCGENGGCCDAHAACAAQSCAGSSDNFDAPTCLFGDKQGTCSPACRRCHEAVLACVLRAGTSASRCCDTGNCGFAAQCILDGTTVTDPCTCSDRGVSSPEACPPPTKTVQIRTYGRATVRAGTSTAATAPIAGSGPANGSGSCPEDPTRPCIVDVAAEDVRAPTDPAFTQLVLSFNDGGTGAWYYLRSVRDTAGSCNLERNLGADATYARANGVHEQVPFACSLAPDLSNVITVRYEYAQLAFCSDAAKTVIALGETPYPLLPPPSSNSSFICAFLQPPP